MTRETRVAGNLVPAKVWTGTGHNRSEEQRWLEWVGAFATRKY